MSSTLRYKKGASRPTLKLWLRSDDGLLIDFSNVGYSYEFKVGFNGQAAVLTKVAGIAGAVGSGVEPSGTPNIVITPVAADFTMAADAYTWQLKALLGTDPRYFSGPFIVEDVIT